MRVQGIAVNIKSAVLISRSIVIVNGNRDRRLGRKCECSQSREKAKRLPVAAEAFQENFSGLLHIHFQTFSRVR
jgi:hypothetical protein